MADELVKLLGRRPPRVLEADGREGGELVPRQPQQSEPALAAFDLRALLARGRHPNWRARQLPRNVGELLRRQRERALLVHLGGDACRHRDVEVGSREPQAILPRLDQDVRENRQSRLCGNTRDDRQETLLEFLPRDRELHPILIGCESISLLLSY